jgi:hypothetical protein
MTAVPMLGADAPAATGLALGAALTANLTKQTARPEAATARSI